MTGINMVMIAAECTGFAKVGGLADVVNDLSCNLKNKVDSIAVFLPGYADNQQSKTVYRCSVIFSGRPYIVKLKYFNHNGVAFYFVRCKAFFGGKYSNVYINNSSGKKGPFEDDARRFAFYSKAVLEILLRCNLFKNINLLHCHDWHTGFLFLLLELAPMFKTLRSRVKTVFTIHNLNYQGIRPFMLPRDFLRQSSFRSWDKRIFKKLSKMNLLYQICYPSDSQELSENELKHILSKTAGNQKVHNKIKEMYKLNTVTGRYHVCEKLSEDEKDAYFQELLDKGCLCFNPMRAAINLSNQVNTVSKTYASEITYPDTSSQILGCGLENDLKEKFIDNRLTGIINGIDYDVHSPKLLKYPFDTNMDGWQKSKDYGKRKILEDLPQIVKEVHARHKKKFFNYRNVADHLATIDAAKYIDKPLIVFVGRTVEQKLGILFSDKESLLVKKLSEYDAFFIFTGTGTLDKKAEILNQYENALYLNVFDEELGNLLYGYADFLLMPSYYEPCGISQLIAMCYGTLPIVNDVGGLHDTVNDSENGFNFCATSSNEFVQAFLSCLNRAMKCFEDKANLEYMRKQATQVRFDWDKSTTGYLAMYKSLF
jgi:starch synthase